MWRGTGSPPPEVIRTRTPFGGIHSGNETLIPAAGIEFDLEAPGEVLE